MELNVKNLFFLVHLGVSKKNEISTSRTTLLLCRLISVNSIKLSSQKRLCIYGNTEIITETTNTGSKTLEERVHRV